MTIRVCRRWVVASALFLVAYGEFAHSSACPLDRVQTVTERPPPERRVVPTSADEEAALRRANEELVRQRILALPRPKYLTEQFEELLEELRLARESRNRP